MLIKKLMDDMNLTKKNIKFNGLSIDPIGKVFFYKGRLFRAIYIESKKIVKDLLDNGLINELVEKQLFPKTFMTNYTLDGYAFVLEHEKIKFYNYAYEWSFDMVKDAALTILKINQIANKYGYELYDCHLDNITFEFNHPKYIDLGSFHKFEGKDAFSGVSIFYKHFVVPLRLWSKGYSDIARNIFLMTDYFKIEEYLLLNSKIFRVFGINFFRKTLGAHELFLKISYLNNVRIKNRIENKYFKKGIVIIKFFLKKIFNLKRLEKEISRLKFVKEKTMWCDYHEKSNFDDNFRFQRITEIVNELKNAESLLDIGANQGAFSIAILEKKKIKYVIATDYDEHAVNKMYNKYKDKENFLSLVFDVIRTNGRIIDQEISERIQADVVLALALTHHLILTHNIDINYIFKRLKQFSKKFVIIEFMPLGLYSGDINNVPLLPDYYNLKWFRYNFKKHYELIYEEKLEINRYVFIGKLIK